MLKRSNLHPYQEEAVSFIKDKVESALFLGLGAGKTISTLTAYSELLDDFAIDKVLIIAPLRVAQTVWAEEAQEWEHLKEYRFAKILGTPAQRLAALNSDVEFYVINRENIPWLIQQGRSAWKFDAIVVDESSSFKNAASKRFRALKKALPLAKYKTILTATPNPNSYLELWSQFYILDMGKRLGHNITAYRNSYFDADYMGWSYELKHGAVRAIQDKISDKVMSASYDDLPPFTDVVMESPLKGDLLKKYYEFRNEAIINLGNEDKEFSAVNMAVLTGKLLQFSSGAIYDDETSTTYHTIHEQKFDMLDEILEFNPDENIIVVYQFKHELERLKKRYPHGRMIGKDGKEIELWNKGKIKMLFIHPQSAGHGIQLQKGGHIMVFFGFTFSLEYYKQVRGRIYRQGQTEQCQFIHLAVGEAEYKLMRTLTHKDVQMQDLLETLKRSN